MTVRADRRAHRPGIARGDRSEASRHAGKDLRPIVRLVNAKGKELKIAGHRHAGAVPAAGRRDRQPAGRRASRRGRRGRAIPQEAPRPATSPAVCRALPTCSKRASRRTPAILAEYSRHRQLRQGNQGQAAPDHHGRDGDKHEELIPKWRQLIVFEGEHVERGESVVDGEPNPHDILRLQGVEPLAKYLVDEIQDVYRLQGVKINDKHIEMIIRQMLRKVEIVDTGDTRSSARRAGRSRARARGERPRSRRGRAAAPTYEPVLLGITKASLATESFISAASFQETTRVLTEAAVARHERRSARPEGKRDRRPPDSGRYGLVLPPARRRQDDGASAVQDAGRAAAGFRPATRRPRLPRVDGCRSAG